jgi:peroxiredoxin
LKTKLAVSFLIFLAIWGVYSLVHQYTQPKVGIKVGERAPNFELENLNGKTTNLSEFRGDMVILNFWATWCSPCNEEIPLLKNFYKENKDKKIVLLGINATSTERNKQKVSSFSQENHINYPVLLDTKGKYADIFQVNGYPTTFFIDEKGIIRDKYVGQLNNEKLLTFSKKFVK